MIIEEKEKQIITFEKICFKETGRDICKNFAGGEVAVQIKLTENKILKFFFKFKYIFPIYNLSKRLRQCCCSGDTPNPLIA